MNRPESDIGETPSPGYALLSVYDKTGLVEFARVLADAGYRLVSTGGTFAELQAAGLEVRQVSQVTGSPEILDGRVKTLHPAIHGGLLARRSEGGHMEQIAEHRITPVDVVVNNLYPFTDIGERERSDAGRRAGEYRYRRSGDDSSGRQELPRCHRRRRPLRTTSA